MTTFYVATLARYVLVEAEDESAGRIAGRAALHELYADIRERLGREVPIEIRTIRPATTDEIEFCRWNEETLAAYTPCLHTDIVGYVPPIQVLRTRGRDQQQTEREARQLCEVFNSCCNVPGVRYSVEIVDEESPDRAPLKVADR